MARRWNSPGQEELVDRGFEAAKLAGGKWLEADHLVAVLLAPPKPTGTLEALTAAGLTHHAVVEALRQRYGPPREGLDSITMGPTVHEALAFANGLALAGGADRIDDLHLLHGLLFVASTPLAQLLRQLDLTIQHVMDELRFRDLMLVQRDPPAPFDPGPLGPRMYFAEEHAGDALRAMIDARALERGFWGWAMSAWRPGHRMIDAEWVVDAPEILVAALPNGAVDIIDFDEANEYEAAAGTHTPLESPHD